MEQSSASAAIDPDRQTIKYFEDGGANPMKEDIELIRQDEGVSEDKRCATFAIKNEDHTLGNALRHIIMQNPDVDFCGYSIPHPSEAKIHIRIQSRGPPPVDILRKGLDDLKSTMEIILQKFNQAVAAGDYEHYPDLEI